MEFTFALFCLSAFLLVQGLPNPEERAEIESSLAAEGSDSAPEVISSQDEKFLGPIVIGLPGLSSMLNPTTTIITRPPQTSTVIVIPPNPPVTTSVVVPPQPINPVGCGTLNSINPIPCFQFSTGCYCISQTPAAWRTAFDTCAAGGKQLVSIDSLAKSIDLQNNLQKVIGINTNLVTQGWWTSGLYSLPQNNFVWVSTGTTFAFTNWAAGNPSTPTAAQLANGVCVHVAASGFTTQFWDQRPCTASFPYICQ